MPHDESAPKGAPEPTKASARVAGQLSDEHRANLRDHAITDEVIEAAGIFSAGTLAELPYGSMRSIPDDLFPAIVFPYRSVDGRVEYQIRPDWPGADPETGRAAKYRFRSKAEGFVPVLWAVRHLDNPDVMLFVEGTKQALAAASHATEGIAVYGLAGKDMWMRDGVPIDDLQVVDDNDAVVTFDADAAGNLEVYDSALKFGEALKAEGAGSVRYGRLAAGGTAGLDDVLAGKSEDRRAGYLARLIDKAGTKPAARRPRAKPKNGSAEPPTTNDGRVTVIVTEDRRTVIDELTTALVKRFDGVELFCHGGVISRLRGHEMEPVDDGTFNLVLQDAAVTMTKSRDGLEFGWPDRPTMRAILASADKFTPLDEVRRAPFARPDGSICLEPGYDAATRTWLILADDLGDIEVPESPTDDEVTDACELILTEWLGDMPFPDDASRANALGLVVTPFVRAMLPRVPLAVIDGLQMGVGKNLLADCVAIVATGEDADPLPYATDDAETRKVITAAFRTGAEMFIFDEAHSIEGSSLARALTAATWKDRILGVSTMADFPNRITWVSLGNQVTVNGDLARRVYRIALRPTYANPQDRPAKLFRHPGVSGLDLAGWTRQNRARLIQAILTLVRRWFVDGQRPPIGGASSFGSFETWERVVGGIVETANVDGFLDNLSQWRSESDFGSQWWTAHVEWLHQTFDDEFTSAEVRHQALADALGYPAPPNLDDTTVKDYAKRLGQAYHRIKGRNYGGYSIERAGTGHDHKAKWKVVHDSPDSAGRLGGPGGPGEPSPPTRERGTRFSGVEHEKTRSRVKVSREGSPGPPAPPDDANDAEDCPDCGRDHGSEGCDPR